MKLWVIFERIREIISVEIYRGILGKNSKDDLEDLQKKSDGTS